MPDEVEHRLLIALPIPAVMISITGRIEAWNDGASSLLGSDLLGKHYLSVSRQPGIVDTIDQALTTNTRCEGQFGLSSAASEITYRVVVAPLRATKGPFLISFEDISHLNTAGRMRRDFVANVSHELRTPLTAVMGYIETLNGPAKNDAVARERFLGQMMREARRMNRLVGDLLSLSRVESVERHRPTGAIPLRNVLTATTSSLAALVEDTGTDITLNFVDQAVEVRGDEDQLRQVFNNLVENAIKYGGEQGKITISVGEVYRDANLRCQAVRVDVSDNGPGIDPLHLPRLTERFYRIDEHRSREMGGTGLGLAIVKHIVNRHRGRMEITSTIGQGSQFSVILPVG